MCVFRIECQNPHQIIHDICRIECQNVRQDATVTPRSVSASHLVSVGSGGRQAIGWVVVGSNGHN